jgi:hypothetical protein
LPVSSYSIIKITSFNDSNQIPKHEYDIFTEFEDLENYIINIKFYDVALLSRYKFSYDLTCCGKEYKDFKANVQVGIEHLKPDDRIRKLLVDSYNADRQIFILENNKTVRNAAILYFEENSATGILYLQPKFPKFLVIHVLYNLNFLKALIYILLYLVVMKK